MIKKLASTLPNFVHSIFSKLNKDDNANHDQAPPSPASTSNDTHPAPSRQIKNPFFATRDYLDTTFEAICSKAGLDIPAHVYHALIGCLLANDHLMLDSSYLGDSAHVSGFALLNMLPYLVGLRCSYIMCTASTSPQELFRKLIDPHSQTHNSRSQGDSDLDVAPNNLSLSYNIAQSSSSSHVNQPPSPHLSPSSRHKPSRSLNTNENAFAARQHARHRRNSSRLRPNSITLSEDTIQHALHANFSSSQSSLPHSPSADRGDRGDRERGRGQAIFAQVLIVDNMAAAPPQTLTALYQVMKTRQVPFKGYKYNTPSVFIVIGISGKQTPPIVSSSPFLMNIPIFDPLVTSNTAEPPTLALSEEEIVVARTSVNSIYVAQDMHQYIRNIVMSLRNHPALDIGPDTRAVSALDFASRSAAVISGQKFVTPTHILSFVAQVLNHRMAIIPINPSTSPNPFFNNPPSSSFVHATSKFLSYVHSSRHKNTEILSASTNSNNDDNPVLSTPTITVTTTTTTTTTSTTTQIPTIQTIPPTPTNRDLNNNNNLVNNTTEVNLTPTYTFPNFPTSSSAEVYVDSFEVIESLLNQLDVPV